MRLSDDFWQHINRFDESQVTAYVSFVMSTAVTRVTNIVVGTLTLAHISTAIWQQLFSKRISTLRLNDSNEEDAVVLWADSDDIERSTEALRDLGLFVTGKSHAYSTIIIPFTVLSKTANDLRIPKRVMESGEFEPFCLAESWQFYTGQGTRDFFTSAERIRCIRHILSDNGINLELLGLHAEKELSEAVYGWGMNPGAEYESRKLTEYFGSEIGFYFSWLSMYTDFLVLPAWLGIVGYISDWNSSLYTATVAILLGLWSIAFLTSWSRKQPQLAKQWRVKPELFPGVKPGTTTSSLIPYMTYSICVLAVFGVVVFMLITFSLEDYMKVNYEESYLAMAPSIAYGCCIPVFNMFYGRLAENLTRIEGHSSTEKFHGSLILKQILFQFFNSYLSLFYILLVRQDIARLKHQLVVILVTLQVVNNIVETLGPVIQTKLRSKGKTLHGAEAQIAMEVYENTFYDYLEMVIQFGYVCFFGWVWPLAPLFALLNNVIELRSDVFKLYTSTRRPGARSYTGIGQWMRVLQIFTLIGVVSNLYHAAFQQEVHLPSIFYSVIDQDY